MPKYTLILDDGPEHYETTVERESNRAAINWLRAQCAGKQISIVECNAKQGVVATVASEDGLSGKLILI